MAIVNGSLQEGYKDAAWFAANPTLVLLVGQKVNLEQTGTYKLGDGTTQLSALSFLGGSGSGLSGLTTNKVLKATSSTTAGDSNISDDGTNVYVNGLRIRNISNATYFNASGVNGHYWNSFNDAINLFRVKNDGVLNIPQGTSDRIMALDTNKDVVYLSTTTYPSLTELSYVKGVTSALQTQLNGKVGIESIVLNPGGTLNPADATTYYFGSFISTAPTTATAARRVYLGKDCSIIGATFSLLVSSTLGSAEDINVYIRVNNTTDYSIGTIKANSATQQVLINTSMSVVLTSTDYFEMKMVMPPFVTNPVTVSFTSVVNVR